MKFSYLLNILLLIAVIILVYKVVDNKPETVMDAGGENKAIENIMKRKSVRIFLPDNVEEDKINTMLKAGMAAPSGMDKHPWEFVVVRDKEILKDMGENLANAKMLKDAPLAIVVCGDTTKSFYWYLDCSAVTQNILLAAEALDLGAVWTAAYPYEDRISVIREKLNLPEHIQPLAVIPIGYPATEQAAKDKYNPEVVHWEMY